jgi:hypothetical protein
VIPREGGREAGMRGGAARCPIDCPRGAPRTARSPNLLRAAPLVHTKDVVHADSVCLKFFRTHRYTPNNTKLSGLAKSEDFHAIAEGPLV